MIALRQRTATVGREAQPGATLHLVREQAAPPGLLPELQRSLDVLAALVELHAHEPLEEVRFPATGALGWATGLASRQQGALAGARLVIELEGGDAALAHPLQPGQGLRELQLRDAARAALRDADEVLCSDEVRRLFQAAGLTLASPRVAPAFSPERAPRVSVIVTHRDLGGYLPAALDSVRAQTVAAELILVDDGSGSDGLAAVSTEAGLDPELRVIHRLNGGPGAARNTGARAATGELLLFLDADNVLLPDCLAKLLRVLAVRPAACAVVPSFHAFDEATGELVGAPQWAVDSPAGLFLTNTGGDTLALHRRDAFFAVGGFDEDRSLIEDWDLWCRYAAAGLWRAVEPTPLFRYRVRSDSRNRSLRELEVRHFTRRLADRHAALLRTCAGEAAALLATEEQRTIDWLRGREAEARAEGQQRLHQAEAALERCEAQGREQLGTLLARSAERDSLRAEAEALRSERELLREELRWRRAQQALEQARNEALASEATGLRGAIDELGRSSAVQLARWLKRAAPGAHRAFARLLRALLRTDRGGAR